jgi:phthiodiolone/phenolphthiodiolone dimycocerosates ketoreductase
LTTRGHSLRFGVRLFLASGEPFEKLIDRARLIEKAGYDSVFLDDHLLYGTGQAAAPEPFTTIATIAAQTRTINIGVAVTDLVRRHPAIVAQTIATLAAMFPHRLYLGLGAGDPMNQAPFGMPTDHRYTKLEEGLKVMKHLWNSTIESPANFKGQFYSLSNAYLQIPNTSPVPVYLAAFGDKMLRLTGTQADGWIPHCHTTKTYKKDMVKIRKSAHEAQRQLRLFTPAYYTLASISKNPAQADRQVLGPARYFLALIPEALKKVDPSTRHPGRVWERLKDPKKQRETIHKIAQSIPDQTALDTVIHGTPDDCVHQIAQFQRAGCREFMLTFVPEGGLWSTKGILPQARLFKEKVISHFRE